VLDQEFNSGALHRLREAVLACAMAAGMPESRATDVMLVVHELAANAVRYGGGRGRVCIWVAARALHCQVTDPGIAAVDGNPVAGVASRGPAVTRGPPSWPYQPGHGLWLIQRAADNVTAMTGPGGSQVTASFALRSASLESPGPGRALILAAAWPKLAVVRGWSSVTCRGHRVSSVTCTDCQHVRKYVSERDLNPHGCDLRRCSPGSYRRQITAGQRHGFVSEKGVHQEAHVC
jgi:anti-sigma regulatory factor (Ser/Thr protein kinase)